jgi:ubiquinone/menaquinone biosynthesis C-methylase UbiE
MRREINMLRSYPQTSRDPGARAEARTDEDICIAREFGLDFFDGARKHGYGGYHYHERFWTEVVHDIMAEYNPKSVLDVGCAKGFMLHDFRRLYPHVEVRGIDISQYAISQAHMSVAKWLECCSADCLPYGTGGLDLVISINTIHNLPYHRCAKALEEIERVKKKDAFITVDAYRTDEELTRMMNWNLTAQTILHVDEWKELFQSVGYTGDYYWFIP